MTVHRGPARTNCGVDTAPFPVSFAACSALPGRSGLRCLHRDRTFACAAEVAAAAAVSAVDVDVSAADAVAIGGGDGGDDGIRNVISDCGDDNPPNGPGDDARMSLTEADDVREACFDNDDCVRCGCGENGEDSEDSESDKGRDRRNASGPDLDPGDTGDAMCGDTRLASRDPRGPGAKPFEPKGPGGGAHAEPCWVLMSFAFWLFRFFGLLVLALSALALRAPT